MKKLAVLALVGIMAFGLLACGKENADNENDNNSQNEVTENEVSGDVTDEDVNEEDDSLDVTGNEEVSETENIRNAVAEALGENYWPNMIMPEDMLEGIYGITADMYDEVYAESPMISANVDTLIIVKAKEDKVQEVEEVLTAYRDDQIENGLNYPMNLGKIQAAQVATFGNYVCFVQLGGDFSSVEADGDEAIIEFCQKENEKALATIEATIAE